MFERVTAISPPSLPRIIQIRPSIPWRPITAGVTGATVIGHRLNVTVTDAADAVEGVTMSVKGHTETTNVHGAAKTIKQ